MTAKDRKLLNLIQREFPVVARPYLALGKKLKMREEEVIKRLAYLKAKKIIRHFGPSFDSRKLKYTSTLVAAKVPLKKLKSAVKMINAYPEITHNYLREGEYNIWFAIVAKNKTRLDLILKELRNKTGIAEIFSLPSVRLFKIVAVFQI